MYHSSIFITLNSHGKVYGYGFKYYKGIIALKNKRVAEEQKEFRNGIGWVDRSCICIEEIGWDIE